MTLIDKVTTFVLSMACFFGWNDWIANNEVDKYLHPQYAEHCIWCGKRRK